MRTISRRFAIGFVAGLVCTATLMAGGATAGAAGSAAGGETDGADNGPAPVSRGDRRFGIAITEGPGGFPDSYRRFREAGGEMVEIGFRWDYLESEPGVLGDALEIFPATAFFAAQGVAVGVSFASLDTVMDTRPPWRAGLPWDDPQTVSAAVEVISRALQAFPPDLEIAYLSLGNEVDLVLEGTDWDPYIGFVRETRRRLKERFPNLVIGVKCTITGGFFGGEAERLREINAATDAVLLNYYPQGPGFRVKSPLAVREELEAVVAAFPERRIFLTELGYQSGDRYCRSSEEMQADFYRTFFEVWDEYADTIELALLVWLTDVSPETLDWFESYYGLSHPAFREYLGTLGLIRADGTDKPAYAVVKGAALARGWIGR